MNQEHNNLNQSSKVTNTVKKLFGYTNAFVTFLASLATFLAFCFAIYAYYYSSIPEQLVSKLNSDIAVLNEEVIDMKREKRVISSQLLKEKSEFEKLIGLQQEEIVQLESASSSLEKEISTLSLEKERLLQEKNNIETANTVNKKYRKEYLADSVEALFGKTFITEMQEDIKVLRIHAQQANDYLKWLNVVSETKKHINQKRNKEKSSNWLNQNKNEIQNIKNEHEFISYRSELIPNTWLNALIRGNRWFREQRDNPTSDENKKALLIDDKIAFDDDVPVHPRLAMTIDLLHAKNDDTALEDDEITNAFRTAIAIAPPKVTALDYLEPHITKRKLLIEKMDSKDKQKTLATIERYLLKYDSFLKRPVVVIAKENVSDENVVETAKTALDNISHFEKIVQNMGQQVAIELKD